ncbi:MAG: 3'-5' exonuclease, partial [Pelistega sp.]|nr:3'-5' exonuclease [Pelistega sp.]
NPLEAWLDWDGHVLSATVEDVPLWKGVMYLMMKNDGDLRNTISAREGVDPKSPYKKDFVAWLGGFSNTITTKLKEVYLLPDQLITKHNLEVFQHFFECLALSERCLQEVFKEQAEVDFTEIAQRALRALGSQEAPTEMLLKIDADLKHILIDEFQDTSFSQKELLDLITSGWSRGDGRTLFLVGDPMQSIYRFRNAEVSLFLNIAEAAAQNKDLADTDKQVVLGNVVMDLLLLEENFRSDGGVVNWVNQTFTHVFPATNQPSLGAIRYTPSNAFKPIKYDPAVRYYPFTFNKEQEDGKNLAILQAQQCGVKLVQQALQAHPDSDNAVAVLVRSRSHLEGLAEALAEAGIPVQAVKMVPLGETEEVADLVQLVRALTHRNDRLAWMSLLRSPFCGLTLRSLTTLFEDKTKQSIPLQISTYLKDEANLIALIGAEETQRLAFIEQALSVPYVQSDMTFTAYVEQCWERLGGNRLYASEAAQENIQAVLHVVDTLAPYGSLDLNEFERQIASLYAAPTSEKGAVQIMTMHSAKGLEFEEVILFGLHKQPRPDTASLLEIESEQGHLLLGSITHTATGKEDQVSRLIRERNKERQSHEVDRLLYVACTRAKEKLHLVYVQNEDKSPLKSTMLSRFESLIDPALVVEAAEVEHMPVSQPVGFEVENPYLKRYTLSTMTQLRQQHQVPAISFSAHQGGAWVFEDKLPSAIGTTVHYWLEQMGLDKLQGWSVDRIASAGTFIKRQLRHLGVSSSDLEEASQRVIALLSGVLTDEKGRWLLTHPGATQEWSLFNEEEQNRIVDLALSTEEGWLIVDYKTNQRFADESVDDFKQRLIAMYSEQLKGYANYLQNMDGRTAKTAIYALDGCVWIEVF